MNELKTQKRKSDVFNLFSMRNLLHKERYLDISVNLVRKKNVKEDVFVNFMFKM